MKKVNALIFFSFYTISLTASPPEIPITHAKPTIEPINDYAQRIEKEIKALESEELEIDAQIESLVTKQFACGLLGIGTTAFLAFRKLSARAFIPAGISIPFIAYAESRIKYETRQRKIVQESISKLEKLLEKR